MRKQIRGKGLYTHKYPRSWEISKGKKAAFIDISKECGKDKFYTQNLVIIEYLVVQLCNYPEIIIQIP